MVAQISCICLGVTNAGLAKSSTAGRGCLEKRETMYLAAILRTTLDIINRGLGRKSVSKANILGPRSVVAGR